MSYYTPDEMKQVISENPNLTDKLYCRGFLFTTKKIDKLEVYPFYGNWSENIIETCAEPCFLYTHKDETSYIYKDSDITFFLIGHAYDPFHMIIDEMEILKDLANALKFGDEAYWDRESDLTGVFCIGYITKDQIIYATDCAGMQLVNHGIINNELYLTSHSKLVADLLGLSQPQYIQKLVNSRFWHYFGNWLPGDLSPFDELKKAIPNFAFTYDRNRREEIQHKRIYPLTKINEVTDDEEYRQVIRELGSIMSNTMACIARKWPREKVSISVTGGRDSLTALACARDCYRDYSYFSYISNEDERVDAEAANKVLKNLGLDHEIYYIPFECKEYKQLDAFRKIVECNAGCIGGKHTHDLKKRLYFISNPPCDIEVKSWVNEMGRGWYQNKFNKKKFPKYPYAAYWRAMHKVYVSPHLIHQTNKVFRRYLEDYYDREVFDRLSWLELNFWEFSWSGYEGVALAAEHRTSYDITIPFNNRKYVSKMLTVPVEKRISDDIPHDLIKYIEPRISNAVSFVKDVSHTDKRALIERIHLELSSKLLF